MDPYNCTQELHGGTPDNRFYLMDALEALEELLPQYAGKVQLIYLDPPFLTGDTFSYRQHIALKGHTKPYTLEQTAYSDALPPEEYYAFMRKILAGCHELLSREGSIYLHVDARAGARLRLLLDEIFGENNFLNEIIWHYKSGGRAKTHYSRKHDNIYFYRKSRDVYFDIASVGVARGRESRNHMRKEVDENGRVVFTIRSGGKVYTYSEDTPVYPSDVWADISHLQQKDPERTGYDTQKPEALLHRILRASSRPGDLVLDLFSGSGTTAIAALQLNRRFIAVDSSPFAMQSLRRRLLSLSSDLLDLTGPGTLLSWPSALPPAGEVEYKLTRANGRIELTLEDYRAAGKAFPGEPLSQIEYCALGRVHGGVFSPFTQSLRMAKRLWEPPHLYAPDRRGTALLIADIYGGQSVIPLDHTAE